MGGQLITGPVTWIVEGGEKVGIIAETGSAAQAGNSTSSSTITVIGNPPSVAPEIKQAAPPVTLPLAPQRNITRSYFPPVVEKVISNGLYSSGDAGTQYSSDNWVNFAAGVIGFMAANGFKHYLAGTPDALIAGSELALYNYDSGVKTLVETFPPPAGNILTYHLDAETGVVYCASYNNVSYAYAVYTTSTKGASWELLVSIIDTDIVNPTFMLTANKEIIMVSNVLNSSYFLYHLKQDGTYTKQSTCGLVAAVNPLNGEFCCAKTRTIMRYSVSAEVNQPLVLVGTTVIDMSKAGYTATFQFANNLVYLDNVLYVLGYFYDISGKWVAVVNADSATELIGVANTDYSWFYTMFTAQGIIYAYLSGEFLLSRDVNGTWGAYAAGFSGGDVVTHGEYQWEYTFIKPSTTEPMYVNSVELYKANSLVYSSAIPKDGGSIPYSA